MQNILVCSVVFLGVLGISQCQALALESNDPEVKAIQASWQRRNLRVRTMKYRLDAKLTHLKGQLVDSDDPDLPPEHRKIVGEGFPSDDVTRPNPFQWSIDLDRMYFRKDETYERFNLVSFAFERVQQINAYDGEVIWTENLIAPKPEDLRKISLRDPNTRFDWLISGLDVPIFVAHGAMPALRTEAGLRFVSLGDAAHELMGKTTIRDKNCLGIKILDGAKPLGVFYFDLDQNAEFALVRWELESGQGIVNQVTVLDWLDKDGLRLPSKWDSLHFRRATHSADPMVLTEHAAVSVEAVEFAIPLAESDFKVPRSAGKRVYDFRNSQEFVVAPDGKTLQPSRSSDASGEAPKPNRRLVSLLLVVNAIVIAVMFFVWRISRNSSKRS